jgi:hypothetical protein
VLTRSLPAVGLDLTVLSSGQVQLVDTTAVRAETGGRHEALYALHLQQLRQATREGFAGLALTGDGAAMHTIARDDAELSGYERDLERLAAESGVRSLCRYPPDERAGLLGDMLAVHYRDVADEEWTVEVVDRWLRVRGELDFSSAGRFTPVLRAALAARVHRRRVRAGVLRCGRGSGAGLGHRRPPTARAAAGSRRRRRCPAAVAHPDRCARPTGPAPERTRGRRMTGAATAGGAMPATAVGRTRRWRTCRRRTAR